MNSFKSQFWRDTRMPYVETRRACESRICYQAHSHETFSIGAVDQGQSRFQSHLTGQLIISAKTLVLMPAHVVHSCNPMPEQLWSYQMMHIDAAWLNRLLQEHQIKYPDPAQQVLVKLQAKVLHDIDLYHQFTKLNDLLFDSEVTIANKEQSLIELLIAVFRLSPSADTFADADVAEQQWIDILEWLAECDDFISLEDLAKQANMSRFALIRLFKKHFGLAPHAYQINLRMNQARKLLCAGYSLADVAFTLGFCDQSHFHRSFKAYTGVTPKQYQQSI